MNFKLTFSLIIVLLCAAIIFMLIPKGPQTTKPADSTTPLISPAPQVRSITYLQASSTGPEVQEKFEKQGTDWKMTAPINAAVDSFAIGDIASTIEGMSYQRKFEPEGSGEKSAEATGTDNPRNIVKFTDDKGKEYTINFGKRSEDGYFATLNGDKTIYVLSASPIEALDKDPESFRNKTIKQLDTSKITRLEVKTPDSDVKLSKSGDKWVITFPVSARANEATVEDLVKEFGTIQALKFSSLNKEITQLSNPPVSVTAWVQDQTAATPPASAPGTAPATNAAASQSQPAGTAVTLQFGVFSNPIDPPSSPVYASLEGSPDVFTYSRDSYNKMNHSLQDLRDPAVTPAPVRSATAFSIITDGVPVLSGSKKNDIWTIDAASLSLPGDAAAISNYLGNIADLRAIKYVDNAGDLKSIGLDPPHMKIELTIPDQSQHEVLLVGKPETADPVTPVMRQGEPTVYLLQTPTSDQLATTKLALRDHSVEMLNADRIRSIQIAGPSATAGIAPPATAPATSTAPSAASAPASAPASMPAPGVTLERDGSHWLVKKDGASLAADDVKMTSLLADFTPLTAVKYLDDKPVDASESAITVSLTVLEPTLTAPSAATNPATAPASPATSTAPATRADATQAAATAPAAATGPAVALPPVAPMGPDRGKLVTHTLHLYKVQSGSTTSWKAVWDNQSPAWTFQPAPALIDHLTTDVYVAASPSTAPATAPAPNP